MPCLQKSLTSSDILRGLQIFRSNVLKNGSKPASPVRIGLCVSGGPDSMALASLMSTLDPDQLGFQVEPTAVIINHNARVGSTEEASFVREELAKMRIPARIESIQWPTNSPPLELSNFEHLARRYRYRALAHIAGELRIKHLFLGHHQDDQIETILMRLARNKRPSFLALQGMIEACPIPCCEDVRYAQCDEPSVASTYPLQFSGHSQEMKTNIRHISTLSSDTNYNPPQSDLKMLTPGGICIYRPLLGFEKANLIATCHAKGVNFVTDKSNDDITLTMRNTIRYIRNTYTLPRALQKNTILRLCEASQATLHRIREKGIKLLQSIKILHMDLRSGSLVAQLPADFHQVLQEDINASANFISRLTRIVSPMNNDEISSIAPQDIVHRFLQHMLQMFQNHAGSCMKKSFTYGKVLINLSPGLENRSESGVVIRLSRQPMRQEEIEDATMNFVLAPDSAQNDFCRSKWLFWDKRYWIRLEASHSSILSAIQITPFQPRYADYQHDETIIETISLQKLLQIAAPGKTRHVLPVLTIRNNVVAFPTLHHQLIREKDLRAMATDLGIENPWLHWTVEYKATEEPSSQYARADMPMIEPPTKEGKKFSPPNDTPVQTHPAYQTMLT